MISRLCFNYLLSSIVFSPQALFAIYVHQKMYKWPQAKCTDCCSNIYNATQRKANCCTHNIGSQPAPKVRQWAVFTDNDGKTVIRRNTQIRSLIKRNSKTYNKHTNGHCQQPYDHPRSGICSTANRSIKTELYTLIKTSLQTCRFR